MVYIISRLVIFQHLKRLSEIMPKEAFSALGEYDSCGLKRMTRDQVFLTQGTYNILIKRDFSFKSAHSGSDN